MREAWMDQTCPKCGKRVEWDVQEEDGGSVPVLRGGWEWVEDGYLDRLIHDCQHDSCPAAER